MSNAQLVESLGRLDKALKSMQKDYTGLKSQFRDFQKKTTTAQTAQAGTLKSISDMMSTFSSRMDDFSNIVLSEQAVDANGNELLLGLQKDMITLKKMMDQLQVQEDQQDQHVAAIQDSDMTILDATKAIKLQQVNMEKLQTEVRDIAQRTNQDVFSRPSGSWNTFIMLVIVALAVGAFLYYIAKKT